MLQPSSAPTFPAATSAPSTQATNTQTPMSVATPAPVVDKASPSVALPTPVNPAATAQATEGAKLEPTVTPSTQATAQPVAKTGPASTPADFPPLSWPVPSAQATDGPKLEPTAAPSTQASIPSPCLPMTPPSSVADSPPPPATAACPSNLITNGGFESGLEGFAALMSSSDSSKHDVLETPQVDFSAHTGAYFVLFSGAESGTLVQFLPTCTPAATTCTLSLFLLVQLSSQDCTDCAFSASVGCQTLFNSTLDASLKTDSSGEYVQHTSEPFAYIPGSTLVIEGRNDVGSTYLDDVAIRCQQITAATPQTGGGPPEVGNLGLVNVHMSSITFSRVQCLLSATLGVILCQTVSGRQVCLTPVLKVILQVCCKQICCRQCTGCVECV